MISNGIGMSGFTVFCLYVEPIHHIHKKNEEGMKMIK